MKSDLQLVF